VKPVRELQEIGYGIAIFPGGLFRAMSYAAIRYYEALMRDGSTNAVRDRMYDFKEINVILGTDRWLAEGAQYDAKNFEK